MFRKASWIFVPLLFASNLHAQDISGDWQGTIKVGRGLRLLMRLTKDDDGARRATLFSPDQSPDWGAGAPATTVSFEGSELKVTIDAVKGTYFGKLDATGNLLKGTWTQGLPVLLDLERATKETAWKDPSPHTAREVTVDKNVKLEILDWGGTGKALVMLAGLGNTAHIFDVVAPKLAMTYHVYGITRRGFGSSSSPASGYSADRLADDVLEVLDTLKLDRPVLAGHSIAGQELSSIGSRHPEKVAGLIYLDAGYAYAYYDQAIGDLRIDSVELQRKLDRLRLQPPDTKQLIQDLLQTALPQLQKDLQEALKDVEAAPPPPANAPALPAPMVAITGGVQKYTEIHAPALAIYAVPHDRGPVPGLTEAARAAADAIDTARTEAQAKAFERGVPSARVVRLPHANHYLFQSNEADVLKEMRDFINGLH